MRPARYARRPASTAAFIARAITTGSLASAMAVFMSTPSQPSSIACAASLAVPTPASTSTGTPAPSTMRRIVTRFWMPSPEPIGAPRGMIATAPASSSCFGDGVVDAIDHRLEAFLHEGLRRAQRFAHVGIKRRRLTEHRELDEVPAARLASQPKRPDRLLGGEAAGG